MIPIYHSRASLVLEPQKLALIALKWDKVPTNIFAKYIDFALVFSIDLTIELTENTKINEHIIKLKTYKQSLYRPIYAPTPVELETLKAYIKTHYKTGFICPSKFSAGSFILIPFFFNMKSDNNLYLCVDYQSLNNIIIKNQYSSLLIRKFLD